MMRRSSIRRSAGAALVGVAVGIGVVSPSVNASVLTVSVVNDRGVPQAAARVSSSDGEAATTNELGVAVLSDVEGGDDLRATRYPGGYPAPCDAVPEGPDGVHAIVPSPVPTQLTITVPSAGLIPYAPELSAEERGLVGLINRQREAEGRQPLYISLTLTEAAAGYAPVFPEGDYPISDEVAHCSPYGFGLRMTDAGFPSAGFAGENLSRVTAARSFGVWMNSPGHRDNMLHPLFNAVGVGTYGSKVVLDLSAVAPGAPGYGRARMTADTGDPNFVPPPDFSETGTRNHVVFDPKLRVSRRVQGAWLKLRVAAVPVAVKQGRLILTVRRRRTALKVGLDDGQRGRIRLRPGAWRIVAHYVPSPSSEYREATASARVTVMAQKRESKAVTLNPK
jgi:uncharacterized protein YkwD